MDKEILLREYKPQSMLCVANRQTKIPAFPVFDVHVHLRSANMGSPMVDIPSFVRGMRENGVVRVVDMDGFFGNALMESLRAKEGYEDSITTFGTVDLNAIDEKDFESKTRHVLRDAHKRGMRGLKFLKSLGLDYRDSQGRYIRPDDNRLSVMWETAAELAMPVLIHIADPVAFFTPMDEKNERLEELSANPGWHFGDERFYRFEKLMEMQENLLTQNRETRFILAHVGNYSENLRYVSDQMDRHPNMYVDIAARISELGRQPYTARDFIIAHQDRVLFGTDISARQVMSHDPFIGLHLYYEFLETRNEYFPANALEQQGRWNIYGLHLPKVVLRKIYRQNAERLIGAAGK